MQLQRICSLQTEAQSCLLNGGLKGAFPLAKTLHSNTYSVFGGTYMPACVAVNLL